MSIASRLAKLIEYQNTIKEKIAEKGGEISSDATLADIPTALDSLKGGDADMPTPVELFENGFGDYVSYIASATKVPSAAFYQNQNSTISRAIFPNCSYVGKSAFRDCPSLEELYFPELISTGESPFLGLSRCYSLYMPKLVSVAGEAAFAQLGYGCPDDHITVEFPQLTSCGGYFLSAAGVSKVVLPKVTSLGANTFNKCSHLQEVSVPKVQSIYASAFYMCENLTSLSLPECKLISGAGVFSRCYRMSCIRFYGDTVVSLTHSNAFTDSPIGGYEIFTGYKGFIFVRESMLEQWKTSTNWVYFSARFVGHSDAYIERLDAQQ